MLYETSRAAVAPAALLRAQAGAIRDAEAGHPDWSRIGALLLESYNDLRLALASENV